MRLSFPYPLIVTLQLSASFFVFVSSFFCFFRDVAFSEYFCTTSVFSFYGKDVVRLFLPDHDISVFLPCHHGVGFLHQRSI